MPEPLKPQLKVFIIEKAVTPQGESSQCLSAVVNASMTLCTAFNIGQGRCEDCMTPESDHGRHAEDSRYLYRSFALLFLIICDHVPALDCV